MNTPTGQAGRPAHDRRDRHGPRSEADIREALRRAFGDDYDTFLLNPSAERYDDYLERIKQYVRVHARKITTHQLRNIFSRVKRARTRHDLSLLRPQLAYVAGRAENDQMRELIQLLDDLIRKVDEKTLEGFQRFYEAIIAYHKFYDTKGN